MSARQRKHDHRFVRRNMRRQHQRMVASVVRDPNADLWVGYWCTPDDLLLEYAKAGVADSIRQHLVAQPRTSISALTQALRVAEDEWRECREDQHFYVATMEILLTAGADPTALSSDLDDVLPSRCAQRLRDEFPHAAAPRHAVQGWDSARNRL